MLLEYSTSDIILRIEMLTMTTFVIFCILAWFSFFQRLLIRSSRRFEFASLFFFYYHDRAFFGGKIAWRLGASQIEIPNSWVLWKVRLSAVREFLIGWEAITHQSDVKRQDPTMRAPQKTLLREKHIKIQGMCYVLSSLNSYKTKVLKAISHLCC